MPEVGGGPSTSIFVGRQRLVDVLPGRVRIGDQRGRIGRIRNGLGQRQIHVLARQLQRRAGLVLRQHDAVVADLDLDDVLDAVLRAGLQLGRLDAARGVGDVGELRADAIAEQLEAAAGAGALDLRGLELAGAAELLGDRGGERIHRGRTDDADGIARRLGVRGGAHGADDGGRERGDDEILRVTLFASGCDGRHFMTGRLRKYFNPGGFSS